MQEGGAGGSGSAIFPPGAGATSVSSAVCSSTGIGGSGTGHIGVPPTLVIAPGAINMYKCDVCGIQVSKQCYLESHGRIHKGLPSFKCDLCSGWFTQQKSLRWHYQNHLNMKGYPCEECEYRGNNASMLYQHKKKKHLAKDVETQPRALGRATGVHVPTSSASSMGIDASEGVTVPPSSSAPSAFATSSSTVKGTDALEEV